MTINTTTNKVSYAGNDVTTAFSFPYLFTADGDLVVLLVVDATGVSATQTLTTHYTVAGAGNPAGGTVTMITPPATGQTLVLYRDPELTQLVDSVNGDPFDVDATVEAPADKLTMIAQRQRELQLNALRISDADTATDPATLTIPTKTNRASKFLAFDATGVPIAAAGTSASLGPVTPFIDTLLDDADAATARTTLGAVGLTGNETIDGNKAFSGIGTFTNGIGPSYLQNIGLAASVGSKALTIALKTKALADPSTGSPVGIAFRNTTATTGSYVIREITAAQSIVVPSGATLGFPASGSRSIYVYECDNGTTRELGVSRSRGHSSSLLHNTIAITTAADSALSLYTTNALTGAAVRLIGRLEITTGAVAGEWDNAPTRLSVWSIDMEPYYEEGTFDSGLLFGGISGGGATYATNSGTYTRIGRTVAITLSMVLTSKGAAVGAASIIGLPFLPSTDQPYAQVLVIGNFGNITYTGQLSAHLQGTPSGTPDPLKFSYTTEAGSQSPLTNTNFTNNSFMVISGTYQI